MLGSSDVAEIRVIHSGQELLLDDQVVAEAGVADGSTVFIVRKLCVPLF